MKRIWKRVAIGLGVLIVLAFLGLWIWSATSTYPAGEQALAAMESSADVQVSQEDWILFEPKHAKDVGLIFYPGGLVAPEAYAPVLRQLANEGYLVLITPMPLNLAIFNTDVANAAIEAYPGIGRWVIAGHSLGGAAASIYAENFPDEIIGLALWDSFPADYADLSDNDLAVISIFGTLNALPNTESFDEKRGLLPADADFQPIEGANHAQFGDYGPQAEDVVALISLSDQHEIVAAVMLNFLADLQ